MGRLDGRVVIVTGGAKGIGKGYSEGLANEGASVVIAHIADGILSHRRGPCSASRGHSPGTSAGHGVRVNTLAPGLVMSDGITNTEHIEEIRDTIIAARSIKRDGYPEDLIGALVFLSAAESVPTRARPFPRVAAPTKS